MYIYITCTSVHETQVHSSADPDGGINVIDDCGNYCRYDLGIYYYNCYGNGVNSESFSIFEIPATDKKCVAKSL